MNNIDFFTAEKLSAATMRREINPHCAQTFCWIIEEEVAAAFGIRSREIRSRKRRTAPIAFARQSAMYLAHVMLGLNYAQIGQAFNRDRTTAAHACRLVETQREDPEVDAALVVLEKIISELGARCNLDARS